MDLMPGQENFLWFIADQDKITSRVDSNGNQIKSTIEEAMPAVFNGKMREKIFAKQKFTDEFEAVGGLFYGQCAEYCGNSHAYMSFRALAQTDEDFDLWVKKFQDAQNPNLQPTSYNPESDYEKGAFVSFPDKSLGDTAVREYRSLQPVSKGEAPNLSKKAWVKAHSDDYEKANNFSHHLIAINAMPLIELVWVQKVQI